MFNFLDTEIRDLVRDDCARIESVRDILHGYLKNMTSPRILDLGCGEGKYVDFFKNIPSTYVGCDILASPESPVRRRLDASFVVYDGTRLPFPDECFDMVVLDHVLKHIEKPHIVLSELSRVLKHNGYVIGSVSQLEPYRSRSL
ncbi:MAG: class I SAM-dependent methyltransferase [Candidatus Omnitrophota bacterium]